MLLTEDQSATCTHLSALRNQRMNTPTVPGLPPGYSVERIWQDGILNVRISYQGRLLREETLFPQDWLDEAEDDLALATDMVCGIAAHFAYNCAAAHHCVRRVLGDDGLRDETTGITLRYRHDLHANRLEICYYRRDTLLTRHGYPMPDFYMPRSFREDPDLLWLLADIREDFYELVAWDVEDGETAARVLDALENKRW